MHPPRPTRLTVAALAGAMLSSVALVPSAQAQSRAEMEGRSATIAERYLAVWSASGELSVAGVPYVYGPRIKFYGRTLSQSALEAEKRRALRQWPVRRYAHRPGTLKVVCNVARQRCAATSTIDFSVANPRTGASRRGSAGFDLGISFAEARPVILYEGGTVRGGRRL